MYASSFQKLKRCGDVPKSNAPNDQNWVRGDRVQVGFVDGWGSLNMELNRKSNRKWDNLRNCGRYYSFGFFLSSFRGFY